LFLRDIYSFSNQIDDILDTPAKRTLWFHLIPLLDEYDQEYCKRKLCLPVSTTTRKSYGSLHTATKTVPMTKNTLKRYYYNENKSGFDDDFVLTDREIDNLFDFSHLPENQGIFFIKFVKK
jgi:hypothetical protein